jgi:hypothetical protein
MLPCIFGIFLMRFPNLVRSFFCGKVFLFYTTSGKADAPTQVGNVKLLRVS